MRMASSVEVCLYCANKRKDVCIQRCVPEGKFRHLEPEVVPEWELPRLPSYREFMEWPAPAKVAYLYLIAYYQELVRCPSN
jgi:hypothetical protein